MKLDTDLSRRHFVGRAAKSFLGVSALAALPDSVFSAGSGASALQQVATAKRVIYLYMNGGMSHLDTFDPKKDREVMGPVEQLRTRADDIVLSDNLPLLAQQADKLAVINSMTSTQGAHKQGNYFMHTSYEMRSSIRHPAMGAWLLKMTGRDNPEIPGNVMIGNESTHPGSGFFEASLSPLMVRDPEGGIQNSTMMKGMTEKSFEFHRDLARKLDAPFVEKYNQKNVRAYTDMYDDAVRLMRSRDLAAFDLEKEPEGIKERYGRNSFGQGCLLARRLLEHGVKFVEVSMGGWDTHNANFINVPEKAAELDAALSTLISDLERRGMLGDTLVVLATEFGRTPEINANEGRDHHPQAFSCMLAGGGIQGGRVWGKTDERGAKILDGKVRVEDLNATIAYALGLPLNQVLYSPSARPFTVADKGKPVVGLFA
ncbi:MAG: DUF1501 domain-containing protein [Verrucomicrobiales bacterium]|nr:DUF1501 domain-containing protein [Verrucomicrobiales bacterium]